LKFMNVLFFAAAAALLLSSGQYHPYHIAAGGTSIYWRSPRGSAGYRQSIFQDAASASDSALGGHGTGSTIPRLRVGLPKAPPRGG
jgi:hypothetical protein